jgi:hypothetical protein
MPVTAGGRSFSGADASAEPYTYAVPATMQPTPMAITAPPAPKRRPLGRGRLKRDSVSHQTATPAKVRSDAPPASNVITWVSCTLNMCTPAKTKTRLSAIRATMPRAIATSIPTSRPSNRGGAKRRTGGGDRGSTEPCTHHQYWDVAGCIETRSDQVLEEGIRRPCPGQQTGSKRWQASGRQQRRGREPPRLGARGGLTRPTPLWFK